MKRLLFFMTLGLLVSCSSDDGGSFDDANPNVTKKYVSKVISTTNGQTETGTITYNTDGKVTSVTDGSEMKYFTYGSNGKLQNISGGSDNLLISDVYNTIYEGYDIGEVLEYDSKGNPKIIELYEDDYWSGERYISTATISYDNNPFTFYYTLEAAGIIEVLNNTRINFSSSPTSPEIMMAKLLLPVNNPTSTIIRDEDGQIISSVQVSYNYGSDKYPTSANVIVDNGDSIETYNITYEYK